MENSSCMEEEPPQLIQINLPIFKSLISHESRMMIKKIACYFLIFSILYLNNAWAEYPQTSEDYALLPPYCKARFSGDNSPLYIKWKKRLGHDFIHTHHYCAGLHSLRLAKKIYSTSPEMVQNKRHLLSRATSEIAYMEKHASPPYILFPHIYTSKAETYLVMDQPQKALEYFNKAMNANKKFTKPYALLSDYYVKTNQKKLAREILNEGLKFSSKSKALTKRVKKLSKE